VIKGGHKVGSILCGFLFGYGIGRILLTGLKDVFQSAAIFRFASVSKQFDRLRRKVPDLGFTLDALPRSVLLSAGRARSVWNRHII
jgi:hypothetical protein